MMVNCFKNGTIISLSLASGIGVVRGEVVMNYKLLAFSASRAFS